LAVEVDGVQVQRDDGWHAMKVVTVAPLGPALHHERASRRTHLAWGAASDGAGFEEAEDVWYRAYVEAARRGLGMPAVQTVVVRGDGAEWIWHRAAAFLGAGTHEVVEIVDMYHAYEYLWNGGHALFGAGTAEAMRWVEALKDQLYERGVAPVVAALAASHAPRAEAAEVVRIAHGYVTTQAARMDYPRFVARQFPCKFSGYMGGLHAWRGAFRRAPWATFVRIGGPIRTGRTRARPVRDARAGVVTRGSPPVRGQ